MSVDLAVRNGLVFDGTGAEPVLADVGVQDGGIALLGTVPEAAREIDAAGKVVAPGFIDIHSHSDFTLLVDPRAASAVHQGVTLEVVGNCGFGCFPLLNKELAPKAIYGHSADVPLTWTTAAGYFERLEEAAPAINVLSLVPNGQIRLSVVGLADRPARPDELAQMKLLLDEALEQGAWGYSTGLEYAAERGADEDELVEMCGVCGLRHGIYATHTRRRDEGADGGGRRGVAHGRAIGRAAPGLAPDPAQRDRVGAALHRAGRGRRRGRAWTWRSTCIRGSTGRHSCSPHCRRGRSRIRHGSGRSSAARSSGMRCEGTTASSARAATGAASCCSTTTSGPTYARRDVASIAAERGQDPLDAVYDLLLGAADDPGRLMVIIHAYTEEQQREAFAHPLCVPGSDATTMAPTGPLAGQVFHGAYTWAAWFLRFCVQQERVLSLAEAIHRLTGAPAERLGLRDRGVLRAGADADVVVFDPLSFREEGTTFDPSRLAIRNGHGDRQRGGHVQRRRAHGRAQRAGAPARMRHSGVSATRAAS